MDAIEDKYWDLMTKSLSGNLDADEEKELDAWLAAHPDNENHLQELKEIWSKTEDYKAGFSPDKQKAWRNISSTLELHGKEKPLVPVRRIVQFIQSSGSYYSCSYHLDVSEVYCISKLD
jgi:ferric-dicitrate binding protein FerR (iron transport regulator)